MEWAAFGVSDEIGRLRRVLVHRPGDELKRLTPRNHRELLFDGQPWVGRAQEEHDAFTSVLREHGVEVHYFNDELEAALTDPVRRRRVISDLTAMPHLAPALAEDLAGYAASLTPAELTRLTSVGLTFGEFHPRTSLTSVLHAAADFVVPPLTNLLFMRDPSWWLGSRPWVAAPALDARRREARLMAEIYGHRLGVCGPVRAGPHVEGGDVLLVRPGVIAVGVSERTTPAGVERLAKQLGRRSEVHTILAIPLPKARATMHLDTVLTFVDRDAVLAYGNLAEQLQAWVIQVDAEQVRLAGEPRPLLPLLAEQLGTARLRVIGTGLDPVLSEREQWDDGNNTLALEPGLVVAYERNRETNRRLELAGITVLAIAGSELGMGRGGPRCITCPWSREATPAAE